MALSASAMQAADVERNWARGGTARQSSTAEGGDAARAIDGNRDGDWSARSVTHTSQESQPYWELDLGKSYHIDEIRLYNRTDCCGDRLSNVLVFFTNNKDGFRFRDVASTLVQNDGIPETAVYFATVLLAGDVDPKTGARLPRHTIKLDRDMCGAMSDQGCLIRYLRIQLAGEGTLSVAEVEVIEKGSIPGPAVAAEAFQWAPTDVTTSGGGVALTATNPDAPLDPRLFLFYRGTGSVLHASIDFGPGGPVVGSPTLAPDTPAAVWDRGTRKVYAAVRTRRNALLIAEGLETTGAPVTPFTAVVGQSESPALSNPTWTRVGRTRSRPAVALACGRAFVAWLDSDNVYVATRSTTPASGEAWVPQFIGAGAIGPPSLTINSERTAGVAFVRNDRSIAFREAYCDGGAAPTWSEEKNPRRPGLWARRVSLAAYGPYFLLATLGQRGRPLFAIQTPGRRGRVWSTFESVPWIVPPSPSSPAGSSTVVPPPSGLQEAPELVVMRGMILLLGRHRDQILYWIRRPNSLAAAGWVGHGRVVGGAEKSLIPPAATLFGRSAVDSISGSPAELYLVGRDPAERIQVMSLARRVALDVIRHDIGLPITGMMHIDPQPERGLDPVLAPNLFEHMVGLVALPGAATDDFAHGDCGPPPLVLDRDAGGNAHMEGCEMWAIQAASNFSSAGKIFHEWIHLDVKRRNLPEWSGFSEAFSFDKESDNPADSGMKACATDADCFGDRCQLAGAKNPGAFDDMQDFDPRETTLRRWDNASVCVAGGGEDGRRYQGGLRWYDVGSNDHAFIHMAIAYRWWGDELRGLMRDDLNHGNDQLQRRYNWIKDNYYGGVEFSGRQVDGQNPVGGDRTQGWYGLPSR